MKKIGLNFVTCEHSFKPGTFSPVRRTEANSLFCFELLSFVCTGWTGDGCDKVVTTTTTTHHHHNHDGSTNNNDDSLDPCADRRGSDSHNGRDRRWNFMYVKIL